MSDTTTPITFLDLHLDLREVAMLLEALDTEIQDPLKVREPSGYPYQVNMIRLYQKIKKHLVSAGIEDYETLAHVEPDEDPKDPG
jgi:hypothetical protein